MIRTKTLIASAALAVGPLALMAPANAYYKIGDCGAATTGVTLTVVSSGPHWDVTGHIDDGQGRTWNWQMLSDGHLMYSGTRTGTGDASRYWVRRDQDGSERIKFVVDNAAGTIHCNVALDT